MSINVTNPNSYVKSNPALTALLNEVIQRVADHLQSEIIPAEDDASDADNDDGTEVM